VIWRATLAPLEYCALLARAVSDNETTLSNNILHIGTLFEEALYGPELPHDADAQTRDLKRFVLEVTKDEQR
jgi:hypothetical protein